MRAAEGELLALEARREYTRMSRKLGLLGLLTDLDGELLAAYCDAYARWVVGSRGLQKHGLLTKGLGGAPVRSPYAAIVNQALSQMIRIGAEFGLSPSSRSRIHAEGGDEGNAEDDFFSRFGSRS